MLTQDAEEVPEACCRREPQTRDGVLLNREECLLGRSLFIHTQVCAPGLEGAGVRGSLPNKVGKGQDGGELGGRPERAFGVGLRGE